MVTKLRDKSKPLAEQQKYVNMLLFADYGVGKTAFSGSDDVLFISPDPDGPISAKLLGSTARTWPIARWDDFDECHAYWHSKVEAGEDIPYKWFAVDTLTEVEGMGMDAIMEKVHADNPTRDRHLPALQDYLKRQSMVRTLVKEYNRLPVNMLYTAWTLQYTDAEGRETVIPDLSGGAKKGYTFAKEIAGMMTSVGYMKIVRKDGEQKRRIIWEGTTTKADGVILAKDRTQVLAPYTEDLSLKEIREKIESGPGILPNSGVTTAPRKAVPRKTTPARRASVTRKKVV